MNLAESKNVAGITRASLPGRDPLASTGTLRVLFLTINYVGFRSFTNAIAPYTAGRSDVEAVYVRVAPERWMSILARAHFGGLHRTVYHMLLLLRRRIRAWLSPGGPLDAAHFDAVFATTQFLGDALTTEPLRTAPALGVYIDATCANERDTFGDRPLQGMFHVEHRVYRRAQLCVGMSTWVTDALVNAYGVEPARTLLAPPTAPPRPAPAARAPGALPRIVFVGNDWERKGGPLLLKLHQQKFKDRAELHVVSASAVPDRSAVNVVWHPTMPREKILGEFLPSMDLFVLPSSRDMSPWVAPEAQSVGLPVVMPRMCGIPDLVRDGETGVLYTPGDDAALAAAVEALVSDRALRERLGAAAREHVAKNLAPDVVYGRLIDRLKAAARP